MTMQKKKFLSLNARFQLVFAYGSVKKERVRIIRQIFHKIITISFNRTYRNYLNYVILTATFINFIRIPNHLVGVFVPNTLRKLL